MKLLQASQCHSQWRRPIHPEKLSLPERLREIYTNINVEMSKEGNEGPFANACRSALYFAALKKKKASKLILQM